MFSIIAELMLYVPEEVRQVDPKGTITKFLRPMPGAARMYPETDVSEIEFTSEYLKKMEESIPELYSLKIERLSKKWKCSQREVEDFLDKFSENDVSTLISKSQKGALELYQLVFDLPKDIKKRDKLEAIDFSVELYQSLLESSQKHEFNQKILRDVIVSLYKDNLQTVENLEEYLSKKDLLVKPVDEIEVEEKIKEIIEKNQGAPFGALMGRVMGAFDGQVDGKLISTLLKKLM